MGLSCLAYTRLSGSEVPRVQGLEEGPGLCRREGFSASFVRLAVCCLSGLKQRLQWWLLERLSVLAQLDVCLH